MKTRVGLVTLLAALLVTPAATAATPTQVYAHLLALKFTLTPQISALGSAHPVAGKPSANARAHHSVGEVDLVAPHAPGTNAVASVYWLVFPSHPLAVADYRAFDFAKRKGLTCSKASAAIGFPTPGQVLNGTAGGYGFTEVHVVVDNVIVSGNFDYGHAGACQATGPIVAFNLARWAISELKRAGG
jgi:hypothetical protein